MRDLLIGISCGDEIVAIRTKTHITNNRQEINEAIIRSAVIQIISRRMAKAMSMLDLGPLWIKLSKCPALYVVNEKLELIAK